MQTLTPKEMTLLNYGNGSDMNVKPMPKQGYMALLNGDDDDETTMSTFGEL